MIEDRPRSLADPVEVARRRLLLTAAHMQPLSSYAASLRRGNLQVPDFDPEDAGVQAKALFLFEKPGPLAASSGFISRNNDDPTAENTFHFMKDEQIPRKKVAIWNVIPWWDGSITLSAKQQRDGVAAASDLIALFPQLRTVMFVGNNAALAMPHFGRFACYRSAHPSNKVRATNRAMWDAIPACWAQVKNHF